MDFEDVDIWEDDLDILDVVQFGFPRQIYIRTNLFLSLDNLTFFKRFRFRKETVLNLLGQIENALEFDNDLNHSVSPINQVLLALRFYACGGHISSIADYIGVHTSTASRIIRKVSIAIANLRPQYINMPSAEEMVAVQNGIYQIAAFPRVIGIIDGTHIRIQSPGGDDAEIFRNRKGYFSLNVQVIGNAKLEIMDIVARCPGSSHDATIFLNSRIRGRIEAGEFNHNFLLGDSGYPITNFLHTPLLNPVTAGVT